MPYQRVPADLHIVPGGEIDDLIGLREVERLRIGPQHLPFQSVFRLKHVELAGQRCGVGCLRKLRGTNRCANEHVGAVGGIAQRVGGSPRGERQTECGKDPEQAAVSMNPAHS